MTYPLLPVIVGVLTLLVVIEAIAIGWLWQCQRRLERDCRRWQMAQERQQRDVTGLCAAAVRVDERLQMLIRGLEEMREWIQGARHLETSEEASYQAAIERIREGVGVEELVAECGFTREEANLLIRLYRTRTGEEDSYPGF